MYFLHLRKAALTLPKIPVCMYHGSPSERAELRKVDMDISLLPEDYHKDERRLAQEDSSDEEPPMRSKGRGNSRGKRRGRGGKSRVFVRKTKKSKVEDDESEKPDETAAPLETEECVHKRALKNKFPVVITTYEMIMKDRAHLTRYRWGFIVVDEGHRLKNMDCKLMQEIKQYESAGRMVLTGTPLQARFYP